MKYRDGWFVLIEYRDMASIYEAGNVYKLCDDTNMIK